MKIAPLILLFGFVCLSSFSQAERPNVLVILVDDMGYSDPSFMGGETPTPNIDRLASGGLRFTQCYNSARCCPSRAMLVSGLYPHQTGIGSFATAKPRTDRGPAYLGRLNNQCVTFAEVLKSSGYQTYMVGKWHMEMPGPIARGFDQFYGFVKGYEQDQWKASRYQRLPAGVQPELTYADDEFYATDVFTDYSLEFLRQARQKDQPWLLYLAHSSPHFPVQTPRETVEKFIDEYRKGWDVLRSERFARMRESGLADKSWDLTDRSIVPIDRDDIANGYSGKPNPSWDSLPADRREDLAQRGALSAAMMHHVDAGIGRLISELENHGELDNTLILFMSDNGACYEWGPFGFDGPSRKGVTKLHSGDELATMGGPGTYHSYGSAWANLGNTPFQLYKHYCHEGGNCTPMVAHWPVGIKQPNRWVREPIALLDVMPTLCEVTQSGYPSEFDGDAITPVEGTSLKPIFDGADELRPRTLFAEHQKARSVRRGRWKAVWSKRMPREIAWELYDIQADRCETKNLANEHPELVDEFAREWIAWAKRVRAEPYADANDGRDQRTATDKDFGWAPETQPVIKQIPLKIEATFDVDVDKSRANETSANKSSGVIVAHGGNRHGYSIYLDRGSLVFAVRRGGKLTKTTSIVIDSKTTRVTASLAADGTMRLMVPGKPTRSANAGGLLAVQPVDSMSIGFDDRSTVSDYRPPNRFAGIVRKVQVNDARVTKAKAENPSAKALKPDLSRSMRQPVSLHQFQGTAGAVAKPFFADPFYNGSCDPEIVWNATQQQWFIYYTARRATRKTETYVGTAIGVISSPDLLNWTFRGYCSFDGVKGQPDNCDTHWAPGVIVDGDSLHMFATYKDNVVPPWGGNGVIRHYVAPLSDSIDGWKLVGIPNFNQPDPIDVSLLKMDDHFQAYYRVGKGGGLQWATSKDLTTWENQGQCPGDVNSDDRGFGYQEAPYVFQFADAYWMLTDPHDGLAVFRSDDGITWKQKARILKNDGKGPRDTTRARHPSVAVIDDRAYIVYHVEPNRPYPNPPAEKRTPEQKLSYLQIAELKVENDSLVCDRDLPVVRSTKTRGRWSKEKANRWYESVDWPVGTNFIPSTAINQLEMWQADTFDPVTIDRELGWAAGIGMNSMRVFLHDLAWKQDPAGFLGRIDEYLTIADKHGIRTMFVFFDGVWNPSPQIGKQPEPVARVHNSGWVQSPGRAILEDPNRHDSLKPYVTSVLERFKDDERVLVWDLFNEPDNSNAGNFGGDSITPDMPSGLKRQRSLELLTKTFAWAREVNPSQPLTAGVWGNPDWLRDPDLIESLSLLQSDVITFHTYSGPGATQKMVEGLAKYDRPILCTEYLARANGSTFEDILPIFHKHKIGAYNWGLVDGKTNTIYPWSSWKKTFDEEPKRWHHDVFRKDGTPYQQSEVDLIRRLTNKPTLSRAKVQERPNVVLMMADDMGYSDIGCYGGEINTPNIDALADGGLRFTQFYNTGRCCPTRASLLTGLYSHAAGLGHMVYGDKGPGYRPYLNQQCMTIAEALKAAGYRTMMTGKWHVGHEKGQWPTDRGFQHFYGIHIHVDSYFKVLPGCPVYHNDQLSIGPTADPKNQLQPDQEWYTTDVFTDWSLKFLDQAIADNGADANQPFFLYVAYNSPHWPLEAPQENIDNYTGSYDIGWDRLRTQKLARMKALGIVSSQTSLSPSNCPEWTSLSETDRRELAFRRSIYAAQIERMDQNIGRIITKLKDHGELENTLILFLSDNGCCAEGGMFGYQWNKNRQANFADWRKQSGRSSSTGEAWSNASNTPFRLHKRWVHEGGIATPLIAHWPRQIKATGKLTHQVGHVVDILPTCLDVAGAEYPAAFDSNPIKPTPGKSLVPTFRDPDNHMSRVLFWEHDGHAAIRDGNWKLVTLKGQNENAWELYDLTNERTETNDVADQHPDVVDEMKLRWKHWAAQANVLPWPKDRKAKMKQP